MRPVYFRWFALLLGCALPEAGFGSAKPCYGPEEASRHVNREVCIRAHVYDIVDSAQGTTFLDVCSPDTPDEKCGFAVVSLASDKGSVGKLDALRGQEIQIRGTVRQFPGGFGILLSDARQLHGGGEKFHPNPALMKGFSAEDGKTAFSDPAFRNSGHHHKTSQPAP